MSHMCIFQQPQHPLCHSPIIVSPPQLRPDRAGEIISLSRSDRVHQRALQGKKCPKSRIGRHEWRDYYTTAIVQFIFLTCLSNIHYGFVPSVSRVCLLENLVRPLMRLAEKIYMMLYEEESKGLDGPRRY
jgi:hypothetical protein